MNAVSFIVPGVPVAFARTRGLNRFTPAPQRNWMAACSTIARAAVRGRELLTGPVHLDVVAVYEHPKTWSRAKRASTTWKTSVPDADNIGKLAADALKGIVWKDDAQAAKVSVEKIYGAASETIVTVTPLSHSEV